MATQFFYLEASAINWAKVQEPVLKYGSKTEYEWSLDAVLNPDSVDAFKASKSRKTLKDNNTVKFNRDTEYLNKEGGTVKVDGPIVLLRNKETGDNDPYTGLIGNGSKGIVKISVYDTRMGKGTRLEGVVVTELVPYDGSTPGEPITSSDGDVILPF